MASDSPKVTLLSPSTFEKELGDVSCVFFFMATDISTSSTPPEFLFGTNLLETRPV